MKHWVQFLQESTGYIPGSIPPRFDNANRQLIDACGDRAVFILDGRNSQETMHRDARHQAQRLEHWCQWPAYQLVKGPRLFEETQRGPVVRLTYPIATN